MAAPQPVSSRELAPASAPGFAPARSRRDAAPAQTSDSPSFETILTEASRPATSPADTAGPAEQSELAAPIVDSAENESLDAPRPEAESDSTPAQELPAKEAGASRNGDPPPVDDGRNAPARPAPRPTTPTVRTDPESGAPRVMIPRHHPRERSMGSQTPPPAPLQGLAPAPEQPQQAGSDQPLPAPPTTDGGGRDNAAVIVTPPAPAVARRATAQTQPGAVSPRAGESAFSETKTPPDAELPLDRSETDRAPRISSSPAPLPSPPTLQPTAPPAAAPPPASFLELQPQASGRGSASTTSGGASSTTSSFASQASVAGPSDEFSPQIVRGALAMTRTSGGAMTMRLEPESLGSLRIQMHISQGRVAVQFHAETAQARGLLNQHVETLRTAMESHGLRLENVQIHSLHRGGASNGGGQESSSQQHQSTGDQGSRQDAAGQQSRGHGDTAEREAQYRHAARQALHQNRHSGTWQEQWNAASSPQNDPSQIADSSRPSIGP